MFAGYADFHAAGGGVGAIELPMNPDPAALITTMNVPAGWATDDQGQWREGVTGLIATASVQFTNQGAVMAHPGCTVLSDQGGFGDGHTYVSGMDQAGLSPTTLTLTFQSASPPDVEPPSEIWLECSVGEDHPPLPPDGVMDVRVLDATLSVIPRGF